MPESNNDINVLDASNLFANLPEGCGPSANYTIMGNHYNMAFLRILPFLWLQFFSISLRSGNRFHLFGIYRIFVSILGSSKIGSRVVVFGSGDSL